MNKIIIISALTAAVAAYLFSRRKKQDQQPASTKSQGKPSKHLTNVFARAKYASAMD